MNDDPDDFRLGETGKFPEGKLHPDDEGELQLAIAKDRDGNIHINFGKAIAWVAMPPQNAIELARLLLKAADVRKVEIEL